MRRRWFWVKIGSAVCLLAVMAAAGAFFLNHQPLISSKPAAGTLSTAAKENMEESHPSSFELQPKTAIVPQPLAPPVTRTVPQAKITDRKIPSAAPPKTAGSVAGNDKIKGKTAARPPLPAADAYDRIDDSTLKLQALAWFDDASKRMAVINDRIVREGESVDGYQITQIRQEDVVVSDGSKSWLLKFDLKQ
jgi:hypothetical protein